MFFWIAYIVGIVWGFFQLKIDRDEQTELFEEQKSKETLRKMRLDQLLRKDPKTIKLEYHRK